MKNQFLLMAVFCLLSNIVCSMDDRQSDLSLTQENKDALLSFVKMQFVQQGELPENANLSLLEFTLDTGHRDLQLGQRYVVKVMADWLTYNKVHSEPGTHVFIPEKHRLEIYSHMFDTGLRAAGVNL